jgi:hypothetical protein
VIPMLLAWLSENYVKRRRPTFVHFVPCCCRFEGMIRYPRGIGGVHILETFIHAGGTFLGAGRPPRGAADGIGLSLVTISDRFYCTKYEVLVAREAGQKMSLTHCELCFCSFRLAGGSV